MLLRLTNVNEIEAALARIGELIAAHGEWLCVQQDGSRPVSLRKDECEFAVSHGRLIFTACGERGVFISRVIAYEWTGEKLLLETTRRTGREQVRIELIPRLSSAALSAMLSETRRALAIKMAQRASSQLVGAKVERIGLSAGARPQEPGRYARIILRGGNERVAVTGPVVETEANGADAFLSSALIWFTRASESSRTPLARLWLAVPAKLTEAITRRVAMLREDLRRAIGLYEIDEENDAFMSIPAKGREELIDEQAERFHHPSRKELSESAGRIVALMPEVIDAVRARAGETLRFRGLPFARVRHLMNRERVWFGIEGARRRLLDETSEQDFIKLIEELNTHRRADAKDHSHALYRALPEAWLESMLRRDISRLDPGLRIAPIHAQFRTSQSSAASARPIDLLALRQDGRLVVIELKVREDREHVLQGIDYWSRVEAHRLHGNIERAKLFGDAEIADSPPLVYLVAPMLRFHRAFQLLAHAISHDIEIYRFDINEDWRSGARVMRRARAN